VPLDEALSRVVIDSRAARAAHGCEVHGRHDRQLDTQLVFEFFQGFVNHAVTLHIDNLKGQRPPPVRNHLQGLRAPCALRWSMTSAWRA
jgi:imidazoleglycerol phosphate dehydratase HisB